MSNVITVDFIDGSTIAVPFTTCDVSRTGETTSVNLTNQNGDFAYNAIYDKVLEITRNCETSTFDVKIKSEAGEIAYTQMTATYYLALYETLCFSKSNVVEDAGSRKGNEKLE